MKQIEDGALNIVYSDCALCFLVGVRALYKGLGPTILRTFPATGGLFLAYETTKRVLLGP